MSYRKAAVYVNDYQAGVLEESDSGYCFCYLPEYLSLKDVSPGPVSLTLPLQDQPYISATFFPFFDGLIPEGWLLDVVERTWKVNAKDRMGLLMASCKDTIGNVSIRPL